MVRTGLWTAWSRVMLDPGAVDENVLSALDAYVLTAAKHGILVCFNFFAFLPPSYGDTNPYLGPRAREGQRALLTMVAQRYRGVGWVHWDLINEPSYAPPAGPVEQPADPRRARGPRVARLGAGAARGRPARPARPLAGPQRRAPRRARRRRDRLQLPAGEPAAAQGPRLLRVHAGGGRGLGGRPARRPEGRRGRRPRHAGAGRGRDGHAPRAAAPRRLRRLHGRPHLVGQRRPALGRRHDEVGRTGRTSTRRRGS